MSTQKNIVYVDLPEVSEAYVDSFGMVICNGELARVELCVTRMDHTEESSAATFKRYPRCRLVMTTNTLIEFAAQLSQLAAQLTPKPPVTN